jgi:beta-glucosidase
MISSGEINGTPIHASKHLITDILKTNWVSRSCRNWTGRILYTYTQDKVAENNRDAVK